VIYILAIVALFVVAAFGIKSFRNLPDDIGTHDLADDLHKKVER